MTDPAAGDDPAPVTGVVIGVDTHKDRHVAVAITPLGVRLGQTSCPASTTGYRQLHAWAGGFGPVHAFGVEGTGSYGAGLQRHLRAAGQVVCEVNRPDRATRRRRGKSDPIDAEAAARAVLAGHAQTSPKAADAAVEMIRMVKTVRSSAVKARTQAINQIHALLVTAPAELREELAGLSTTQLITTCADLTDTTDSTDPGDLADAAGLADLLAGPTALARHTLAVLARRAQALHTEATQASALIARLARRAAPRLLQLFGVGPDTGATLLITAGDNPERIHTEAALAALCGTNPIPASSGKTNRHRLNRGGDRQANAALHRIIVVRLRHHAPTRAYMARRTAEGKTKREIIRCLKRYLVREIYQALNTPTAA
ncbi:IS110 family transposase [Pseudonocardia zijingensis]|jgi:transposase